MTLTRLLPTLRRSIPDPIEPRHWPAGTRVTTTDVVVGGFSMLRLAERHGTPSTHLDPAAAGTVDGRMRHLGVVLATVRSITVGRDGRRVLIDAEPGPHRPVWAEARLIGRVSVARVAAATACLSGDGCHAPAPLDLPGDLVVGDLIAVPVEAHDLTIVGAGRSARARAQQVARAAEFVDATPVAEPALRA